MLSDSCTCYASVCNSLIGKDGSQLQIASSLYIFALTGSVLAVLKFRSACNCVETRHSDFRSPDSFVDLHNVGGKVALFVDRLGGWGCQSLRDGDTTPSVLSFAAPPLSLLLKQASLRKALHSGTVHNVCSLLTYCERVCS